MDVTFNNVLEGKVRQYFLGVPKPAAAAEGAGQGAWPAGAPPEEGAPAQSGAPAPSSRPPSAAAAPPASPPALPPRPPTDPMEPEPHIIHKATVMREAAEKRRELPDLDDEEAGGALSPPSHIIRKPLPSPAPAPAAPCPSPARPPSPAPPQPPPARDDQEAAGQFRPPTHRLQTPTARAPDPYAPSRPPDPYSSSRPPEQYGRYHYEASVADGGRTSNGPIASPQPSVPARHSPLTYARISSSIGSVPQHAASRLRDSTTQSPPSQRYAMPPAQPPPPHNDRVPPIHHPQSTPPTQRLSTTNARSSHAYPPLQQRRETSPYARINSHYDRQPSVPTRKYDPQQAYSGYRPSPTAPQILSNHRVDIMQQQIQYKQAAIDALTAEYSARVAGRAAPSHAPPAASEPVRIPSRIDYPSVNRSADARSGYHYPTPSTSSRYVSNVPSPSAPNSTLQARTPHRMAAAPKPNYNYSASPSVLTSPARSTVKPGYPNQKAKPTVSVTSLYNEIKSKREPSAPVTQSKQKRESPLDLSVKTVKNSADSSTTQDDAVDSASTENKVLPLQPRPSSITGRHPHMPAVGFAASHKVDFAPNFNQYGERSTSQGYSSAPQQSHPPVRYNGAYDTRRSVPEVYSVESPHPVYHERTKYGIPVARPAFVPEIDLTRPVADQRHSDRIRDDRNFLIEERKRPSGPIVSNLPEKMLRYETWTSDSRIEQRMSPSAREQHELMNQPVYSYTSHKQLEAFQNEQKAKLFSSSSMYRQNHPQGPHRYPSNVYPAESHSRDVPSNEYHPHYPDRSHPLSSRHHVIQKASSHMRDKDAHLHHLDPHSRVPAKQSVLSILRNSLETKQTGFVDPARSVKPDIIVIDDADDPVIDITKENDHDASIPKTFKNHLSGPASPNFGNHIQMPKAVDSFPKDSEYQPIENPEVKVKSPENDVASRIRTKAELKSMPPSQDNTMRAEIKQDFSLEGDKQVKLLPKSQKQHLFNRIREDLRLESVIKIEKPSEIIIPEVKSEPMNIEEIERDAVIPIKMEDIESFDSQSYEPEDSDWASACDNFMEQLKSSTHKKKTLKRQLDILDNEKGPQGNQAPKIGVVELAAPKVDVVELAAPKSLSKIEKIELPTVTFNPSDIVIKQEPTDEVTNKDVLPSTSLPENEGQKLNDTIEINNKNDPNVSIDKKLENNKKHDPEKTIKIKQKTKSKSLTSTFKKETKESKHKVEREGKDIKGKVAKENKIIKEKKEHKLKSAKEKEEENNEKVVIKTVIKEEQESTDDDEPLIKSKILKEKEESDRLKYQLLKDFTEKSAYVKLECCDVDVNKNNRNSLDSATKEKEEIKPNKGKFTKQLPRSKTKSLSIDNKNEKKDVESSSESDEDLCVASRLRIRKSVKGEESKSTPNVKTLGKSSPTKKADISSASNSSTPVRKPGFGDGSDFHPGWEEELFRYKRSLRMPTRLIAIPRGRVAGPFMRGSRAFFTRGTTSLPDLDPVPLSPAPSSAPSAATDDLYTRRPDKLIVDSDMDSNSSYSAPNRLHYDSEASTSTITSSTKAKKKGSSIVDVLIKKCGRKEDLKRKTKEREEKTPKIIAKSSSELLPTPSLGLVKNNIKENLIAQKEKLEEDIFYLGAFRKETVTAYRNAFLHNTDGLLGATEEFTPVVLKSRTRTESRIIRQRATIKEVFGDERPASAPPTSCRDDHYSIEKEDPVVVKKEPEENKPKSKPKKIVKGKILRRSSSIRDGLRSTKLLKRNDAKGRLMRMKKRNSIMMSMNNKRMKEVSSSKSKNENSLSNNTEEKMKPKEENGSPVSIEGGTEVKKRFRRLFGRRKFSSGFDYIRKKKKISRSNDQVAKVRRPVAKPSPESVIDIQKEIKSWFINKSIGETHLHRAARLGYTDCVAYCLEKMEADPSAKDNAGFTPLHVASAKGHVRIARLLLQYGANVSAAAQGGIRPLHEASENCHVEMMRLLLSYGADPLLGTYAGQTPEELTEGSAARLLQLHIADVQGRAVEPWTFPPPATIIDQDELGYDPLCSPPPASPLPPPDSTIEIQCTEAPLPPFYSLRTAPGQPADGLWCLLQDITNLLQIKSKDSLLKQIHCGSGSPKELLREIRTQEFLERAQCNQLLGAGEKVNVRASKVSLIRVTDKLRQLLKIETVLVS